MKTRHLIAAVLGVTVLAFAAPSAQADHGLERAIGTKALGTLGAQFNQPGDVAVRESTGQVYVVDVENNRVQRFSSSGDFELAWGRDVLQGGGTGFEVCTVASECKAADASAPDNERLGGDLFFPTGIAIRQSTGQVYVTETKGSRVSVFGPDGEWQRSFGWDVIQTGKPGNLVGANEKQKVTIFGTSGSIKLIWPNTVNNSHITGEISFNASSATVEAALVGLPNVEPGDVSVSGANGGPWTIDFAGSYANVDVPQLGFNHIELNPQEEANKSFVQTLANGAAYEVCTVASDCRRGSDGDAAGQISRARFSLPYQNGFPGLLSRLRRVSIAIDQANGDVYVGDVGNDRVNQYDANGNFIRSFGWGVDTGADAFEACTAASACQRRFLIDFNYHGEPANGKLRGTLIDLAFDSTAKTLYAAAITLFFSDKNMPPGHVFRFDTIKTSPNELLLPLSIHEAGAFTGWPSTGTLVPGTPAGIEVDEASGNLLAALAPRRTPGFLTGQSIQEVDPSVAPAASIGSHVVVSDPALAIDVGGFGHDGVRDRFYQTSAVPVLGSGVEPLGPHQLFIFSQAPAPSPVAVAQPATDIDVHSATLNGTVTPNGPEGVDTFYRFEYRAEGSATWLKAPASDENKGDGTSPVPVSKEVTDLEGNTLYHVRVVARRAFHEPVVSAEETFTTAATAPVVETFYPQARYDTGVRLTGLINPNGAPTSYRFEWGETPAYGNSIPVPDGVATGGKATLITEELSGLQPETAYHYRLVGDNGVEESPGDTLVEGEDRSFTTRATAPEDPKRSFEMVSPPFKVTRSTVALGGLPGKNANPGWPSLDGEAIRWELNYFPLLDESGMPFRGEKLITRRTADGWETEALQTLPILPEYPAALKDALQFAASGDLETQAWSFGDNGPKPAPILPNAGTGPLSQYTRKDGTGTKGFSGWVDNVDTQEVVGHELVSGKDEALLNDDGTAMARWGGYRGLGDDPETEADEDPSDDLQLAGDKGGRTAYLQLNPPNGAKDLIGECTGSGASATQIPERDANGTGVASDDFIDLRTCAVDNLTSKRGAVVGSLRGSAQIQTGPLVGNAVTALASNAKRVFFTSPDPVATDPDISTSTTPIATCETATAANTSCPPQLFVRQYDAEGNPTVRWISRSRSVVGPENSYSGAQITKQAIALMGPSVFEGASRDGSTVYFRTNSPLAPDDPNGTGTPGPKTTGSASNDSWDLYRYELPASHEEDPDGGSLTRISGGPSGTADPNTNPSEGRGGTARYISDDGKRAYFVTAGPIAGADETAPRGGVTAPSGAPAYLYLFDDTGESPQWHLVSRIPFASSVLVSQEVTVTNAYDACASFSTLIGPSSGYFMGSGVLRAYTPEETSCIRGTKDGSVLAFISSGQLTEDDVDDSADIYLYDAEADELVRVSAPPTGVEGYVCREHKESATLFADMTCNGEWGYRTANVNDYDTQRGWGGARQFNIAEDASGVVSVIFQSRSQLTAEDENVDETDVYRWREGELELLSSGDPGKHSYYSGNSLDGEDIFIWTNSRIDPREIDEDDYDIYDLRIGEGFPPPEVTPPCDVLDLDCEKAATPPPPPVQAPQSKDFKGNGNVTEKPKSCSKGKVRRQGKCVKRKARKGRAGKTQRGGRR